MRRDVRGGFVSYLLAVPVSGCRLTPRVCLESTAAAFAHHVVLVRRQILQRFNQPVRPTDHDFFGALGFAQSEMQPQVALRNEPAAAANFLFSRLSASLLQDDCRAERGAIRFRPDKLQRR